LSEIFPVSSGGSGSSTPLNPYSLQYALNASQQSSLATGYVDTVLGTNQTNQPPSWIAFFHWSNLTFTEPLSPSSGGTGSIQNFTTNSIVYAASNTTQTFTSPGLYGQVLESTGLDSPPSWTWPSPGTLKILEQNFTSNGTFTFPPNVVYTYIIAIGGGAGSQQCGQSWAWNPGAGAGGGGMSYTEFPGPCSEQLTITVGAGGSPGENGGNTVVGNILMANGGATGGGGGYGLDLETGTQHTGGAGGGNSDPSPSNAQTISWIAPTGGGSGATTDRSSPNYGGMGGNIEIGSLIILQGGFAGNGITNGGPGMSTPITMFCGSGGGGAAYSGGVIPGNGGLYGGGAGGQYNQGSPSCGPSASGASGFVSIMVYYTA